MPIQLDNINDLKAFPRMVSFVNDLSKLTSKKEIVISLLNSLSSIISVKFLSFVEKEENELKVLYQTGDSNFVKNVFSHAMCEQIFDWVSAQKQVASLKIAGKEQFLFVPLIDSRETERIHHGMVVIHLLHPESLITFSNLSLSTLVGLFIIPFCCIQQW